VIDNNQTFFDFQVEKPVAPVPGTGNPRYPDILRSSSIEGEVLAQFVVDTTGRVEVSSFKVIRTSHELFSASVRQALPNMRFLPAEVGGRKVKQLVQQPFVFALQK
jgi:protein TonB